ncbi:SAGA-associated factor 29-like [Watersipora subatra]|uniref:SAGA-associated factor 29-like n=1 Tax=Watersipora subatra TaxID=2589382 RepID=UPI00355C718E
MAVEVNPKLKEMLNELHLLIHKIQEERTKGETALSNIQKIHERVQQESKVSSYHKSKLKGVYSTALADAQSEAKLLQEALEKISEIKSYRSKAKSMEPKAPAMRRGILMSMIHKDAANLPLWHPTKNEKPPPLCGCVPADSNYVVPKGKYVAAMVQGSDEDEANADSSNWILAEVVSYNHTTSKYDVDDVDSDEGRERHILNKKRVIALPLYKADPKTQGECLYQKHTTIMALYPQTTCFYKGVIHDLPKTDEDSYEILFEDTSYPDGYSPPLKVAQRYVIPCTD